MFSDRLHRWKLRRKRDSLLKSKEQAFFRPWGSELEKWEKEDSLQFAVIDTVLRQTEAQDLIELAHKLGLQTPGGADKDQWVDQGLPFGSDWVNVRFLTPEAYNTLRSEIRKEQRERREVWEFRLKSWGTIIAILTGLIGAAIGLVSVLKK